MCNGQKQEETPQPNLKNQQEKLYLLHMDLCGPMRVTSVNGKKYILIIVDDYSRFTWVKCLRSKDEAPYFIIKFLKMIQLRLKHLSNESERTIELSLLIKLCVNIMRRLASLIKHLLLALHDKMVSLKDVIDILFQPLFDELLNPSSSVDRPAPEVIALIAEVVALEPAASTGSPSSTTVDQDAPSPKNVTKWTKDHHLDNIIGELERPISTRLQLHEQALFCYYDSFLTLVEPKNYKDALTQACWIEAMQEELNEFDCLKVWELILQSPRGIFINQSKYALESLKKYGMESSDPVDTPMVEKSKLDEDSQGKAINPIHYRDRLVSWSSKRQKSTAISSTEAEYIALSGCCAQVLWMRSQLTDYGLGFNKIPIFHFIKEQVENGVVELYFVNSEYQLADIFTKAFGRERIEFLINKLGMRSFMPETLKQLADEAEE
ncbi:retrovirus-related pol polyprotein from transposon TNT 1-94 [Tanacetum coccineum]